MKPIFLSSSFFLALFMGFGADSARAILPISHYHDLVAGEGSSGYRDGPFFSALFDFPQGLAIDSEGKILYIADRNNNRIRMVYLDKANRVGTLAGTPMPGSAEGPLLKASFNHPTALCMMPGNQLVIYDSGNRQLRIADLAHRRVSLLAGNGLEGCQDGGALQASLAGVWNVVYFPKEKALYFTQPAYGVLRKLDLTQNRITTLLRQDPRLPRPKALCLFQDHVCVAGDDLKKPVYLLEPNGKGSDSFILHPVGIGSRVLALGSSKGSLYAVQAGSLSPWTKIYPPPPPGEDFHLRSVWGGVVQYVPSNNDSLLWPDMDDQAGMIADPRQPKRFFVSSGYLHCVVSLKDYDFDELIRGDSSNREGLHDFEYPAAKPPRTFRILVVGSSYPFYQAAKEDRRWGWAGGGGFGNRMESMPKRLELFLNTEASLQDVPWHFEVLNLSAPGPSYIWLRYQAPDIIRNYDIDLVLYFVASSAGDATNFFKPYFERPLTAEGIPQAEMDPEFLLKPCEEKVPEGLPGEFYRYAHSKGWIGPQSRNQFFFTNISTFLGDPMARRYIEEMAGKPIDLFRRELKKITHPTRFEICFLPIRDADNSRFHFDHFEQLRDFWEETSTRIGAPFLDLTAPFVALEKTYWPVDESGLGQHFDANGHLLFTYILAQALIDHRLIPFRSLKPSDGQDP